MKKFFEEFDKNLKVNIEEIKERLKKEHDEVLELEETLA